jgi:hypothetical protein
LTTRICNTQSRVVVTRINTFHLSANYSDASASLFVYPFARVVVNGTVVGEQCLYHVSIPLRRVLFSRVHPNLPPLRTYEPLMYLARGWSFPMSVLLLHKHMIRVALIQKKTLARAPPPHSRPFSPALSSCLGTNRLLTTL